MTSSTVNNSFLCALCVLCGAFALCAAPAAAQFNSGSDGSDGVFAPTESVTIDLGEAVDASWDTPSPSPGNGVYDAEQWAVVFKFESVTIPEDVVVTFTNHSKNPPVVWLVQGDVEIAGEINLDGQNSFSGSPPFVFTTPGPGGFAGGMATVDGVAASSGFGPGGGSPGTGSSGSLPNAIGEYGTGNRAYGNQHIIPLIGGSGGGGNPNNDRRGGAGGGAILIASSGTITFDGGGIDARGGAGQTHASASSRSVGGSGGAIRLIANTITGEGDLRVDGKTPVPGGPGRIRLEAFDLKGQNISITPPVTFSGPGPIFPEEQTPRVRMVSIDGNPVTQDPGGGVTTSDAFAVGPAVTILIEASYVPVGSTVDVHIRPASGPHFIVESTPLEGSLVLSTAEAVVTLPTVPSEIQLRGHWDER